MSAATKKAPAPKDVKTFAGICDIPRDNVSCGDYWFMLEAEQVVIAHQKAGESAQSMTGVPRTVFDRFVRWYLTGDADMRKAGNL